MARGDDQLKKVKDFESKCEDDDKCCFFVPIKPGMYIIAILAVLGGLSNIFYGLDAMRVNSVWGIGFLAGAGLQCFAALFYFKWLLKDTKENREGLPTGALINCVAYVVYAIWCIVGSIVFLGALLPFGFIFGWFINLLGGLYIWSVCAKFSEQSP